MSKSRIEELILMCIEMFPPEKAASRIAGFIEADRKSKEDHASFERRLEWLRISGDPTPQKPVGLPYLGFVERGMDGRKQVLSRSITKWASDKVLNLSSDKIKLIVNKILEETK